MSQKGVPEMSSVTTIAGMFSKKAVVAWALIAGLLLAVALLPKASATENAVVGVEASKSVVAIDPGSETSFLGESFTTIAGAIFSKDLALVSAASIQVELARTPYGAKKVAKDILFNEYGFKNVQYECLKELWTEESNWRYKAHNKRSGAHGIPQALPANKMDVVSTDWRTNPVTQIRWGLRYISIRYETPCKALSKHKRSNWY
jgi:Transglycosylase SLT domain